MKLVDPTDDQLNAAFAEHVAGWKYAQVMPGKWWFGPPEKIEVYRHEFVSDVRPDEFEEDRILGGSIPAFTRSADAVLPWMEKCGYVVDVSFCDHKEKELRRIAWVVTINGEPSNSQNFPRAAVIALLRAHGHEIEFTK